MAEGNGAAPVRPALSKQELKRVRQILMSTKTGQVIALLLVAVVEQRDLNRKGKMPLGMSPRELEHLLQQITTGLVHMRDAYVEERIEAEEARAEGPPGGHLQPSGA